MSGMVGGSLAPLRSTPPASTSTGARIRLTNPLQPHQQQEQQQQHNATHPLRTITIDRPQLMKRAIQAALDPHPDSTLEWLRSRLFGRSRTSATTQPRRSDNWNHTNNNDDNDNDNYDVQFVDNVVVSAKYTLWNFFPRVVLAQLQQPSNLYFLFIAMLQTIKQVSNTNGVPTILLPLTIVFICSAIKEALEDRTRHRADAAMNSRHVLCLSPSGDWSPTRWGDVHVGDIVKVLNNETVPADLFLLSTEALDDLDDDDDDSPQQQQQQQQQQGDESHDSSSSSGGVAYIETKSLDGETNLKIRTAIPLVATLVTASNSSLEALNALRGVVECEAPNDRIATFDGSVTLSLSASQAAAVRRTDASAFVATTPTGEQQQRQQPTIRVPITAKQMLLRSCVVRNTRAVVGVAIFTGHETKVCCANAPPVIKTSSVEQHLNALILRVVCIQQLVCLLGALLGALWMATKGDALWYLHAAAAASTSPGVISDSGRALYLRAATLTDGSANARGFPFEELAKLHLRYFIIMQNFVPISLNVSLEFVKYWQAYFMAQDLNMYDATTDTPALVRTSALNEDLGRVHHVFTDKTGTLTMNLMLFRFCSIGGKHYGGAISDTTTTAAAVPSTSTTPFVQFDATELLADQAAGGDRARTIERFVRHLALCHTLLPAQSMRDMCDLNVPPAYSASSPDEQALVSAAAHCNVRFVHRSPSAMTLLEHCGGPQQQQRVFKLLNVLEFDSDRKRMSVIVEAPDGTIELLCKGADNVILERLAGDATTNDPQRVDDVFAQLAQYANAGMRTLCLAAKTIAPGDYDAWNVRYQAATTSIDELVKRRQGLPNAIDSLMHEIELDLTLLGVTAVQDKLQEGVPSTLTMLQQTNIKIWTLTGDKMETAINIGYACALLHRSTDVVQVASDEYVAVARGLQDVAKRYEQLEDVATVASGAIDTTRRHKQQSLPWHERLRASVRTLVLGTSASTQQRKKRQPKRRTLQRQHRREPYAPVTTLGDRYHADAADDTDDDDLDPIDERNALLQRPARRRSPSSSSPSSSSSMQQSISLVIDGKALEHALRPRLRLLFYYVTQRCASVICCRVSPKQKADIVAFVRSFEPLSITLAIGDGANDVGMIQAAHVGVGISGHEGMQAVNSSDYAISQFRFLQPLLFVHGRWAYRRVTKLMSYMLYKNVTYVLTTFWFGCFCGFSGQPLILDVAAQSFNVLYTSVPLVLFAVMDQDISASSALNFPRLYALGQQNALLQRRVFWPWLLTGLWHSLVIFFVSAWALEGDLLVSSSSLSMPTPPHVTTIDPTGRSDSLVTLGFVVFTTLVSVVNLKLVLETFHLTWPFVASILASIGLWVSIATVLAAPTSRFRHAIGEMTFLWHAPAFYTVCVLVVVLSLLRDVLWKLVRRLYWPSTYHILQEREMLRLPTTPHAIEQEYRAALAAAAAAAAAADPDSVQEQQVAAGGSVDYAKRMLRQLPPFESAHESFRRSSPLAESLIASGGRSGSSGASSSQDLESGGRHVRSRASFHMLDAAPHDEVFGSSSSGWERRNDDGDDDPHHERDGLLVHIASSPASSSSSSAKVVAGGSSSRSSSRIIDVGDVRRHEYHGYAFSEHERVDSDVEAASHAASMPSASSMSSSTRDKYSKQSSSASGTRESVAASPGGGGSKSSSRTLKKMLKSVRGPKNA